jgi:nucleoprotein TPR
VMEKFSELQRTLESERAAWTNDKKTLEDTIVDMSTSEKQSESDRSLRESETRRQENRAKVNHELFLNRGSWR